MGPLNFEETELAKYKSLKAIFNCDRLFTKVLFSPQTVNANTNLFSTWVNSRTWTQGWPGYPCWSETILANTKPENLRSAVWFLQGTYVTSILQVCKLVNSSDTETFQCRRTCVQACPTWVWNTLPAHQQKQNRQTGRHICNPSNPRIDGRQGLENQAIGSVSLRNTACRNKTDPASASVIANSYLISWEYESFEKFNVSKF